MTKKAHQPVSLNIDEAKSFLSHIVTNNRYLQENNKLPVAVEVIGDSGIGKTSMVLQVAKELNLNLVKLNLAQIEELGDLVGFPIRQFEVCQEDKCLWIDEHAVEEYTKLGYKFTGQNRMSYCPPEWIAGKASGGFLLLDDWNRADIRFIQAVMELIDRQQYISWSLPKDWHIMLTANPDNGEYLVNSIDNAQKTRFISVNLKYDIKCWSTWAENNQVDGRCINFLLKHPELVSTDINSRSITTFFNSISSLKSFESSLSLIQMIGEGSVGSEFTTMFTMFINNKLDKIISPEDIMTKDEAYVMGALDGAVGKDDDFRADLSSIIATRVINYSLVYSEKNTITDAFTNRLIKLTTDCNAFTDDLRYYMIKEIVNGNKLKFSKLMMNSDVVKMAVK